MIGSVIRGGTKPDTYVWGVGIMFNRDKIDKKGIFKAVRGPRTLKKLEDMGVDTKDIVIGDPACLLQKIYQPDVEKKYKLGIIPHMQDGVEIKNFMKENRDKFKDTIIINSNRTLKNFEDYIDQVNSCEKILSTSLHGIICAHTYNIPVKWMKLGNRLMGDDVKFHDHFESIGLSIDKDNLKIEGFPEDENVIIEPTNHIDKLKENAENLWKLRPWENVSEEYYVDIDSENWKDECYPPKYNGKTHEDVEPIFRFIN